MWMINFKCLKTFYSTTSIYYMAVDQLGLHAATIASEQLTINKLSGSLINHVIWNIKLGPIIPL